MTTSVEFEHKAGIKVRDKILQAEGIITSRVERLNGAIQYFVTLPLEKGSLEEKGFWSDGRNLEVLPKGGIDNNHSDLEVDFEFQTGDVVKNRLTEMKGTISSRRIDINNCIGYWIETTERSPKDGKPMEFFAYEQELQQVSSGLNKKGVDRKKTGCANNIVK